MRIISSDIQMQSVSVQASMQRHTQSLTYWQNDTQPNSNQTLASDRAQLSDAAKSRFALSEQKQARATEGAQASRVNLSPEMQKMIEAIEALMTWLTGKETKLKLFNIDADAANNNTASQANWGAIYQEHHQYAEMQQTQVAMQGGVKTADGRQIDFNVNLALSRSYYSESQVEMRFGNALTDPLIINFAGMPAELTVHKMAFDLNTQQAGLESITQLGAGSGYLVFDRNGDGIINDGSELFGPNTGNGLAELALLDEDGNGWIDEGDSAFNLLQIWQPNADGSQSLVGLAELGIGAIYTRGIQAEFDYKTSHNELQGKMRQAGVFLFEDGRAGSVQQIDLAV